MFGKVTQKVIVVEPYLKAPEIDSGDVRKLTGCRRSIVSGLHSALDPGGSDDTADKGGDSRGRYGWPEVMHCQAVGTIVGIIYSA